MDITTIVNQLKIARDFYYNGRPIMADHEFDELENTLRELDPTNSYFTTVGTPAIRGLKVKHSIPMGSLDQVSSAEELAKWASDAGVYNSPLVITAKLDGNSIALNYDESGEFESAVTRGDGIEGLDVTRHFKRMIALGNTNWPHTVTHQNLKVRAEVIFDKKLFDEVIKGYKNPRNYVAGQLNRTVADEDFLKFVSVIAFDFDNEHMSKTSKLGLLKRLGFKIPTYVKQNAYNDNILKHLEGLLETWKVENAYELDGLVIDTDNVEDRNRLGYDHLNPNFARKFKINVNFIDTEVVDVEWNPSKDGYLKPRVQFEPVDLAGVTISFATGFNAKFIKDNDIGPGAIIKVTRSGDVIPYITEVVKRAQSPSMPLDYEDNAYWTETGVDLVLKEKPDESLILSIVDFFRGIDAPLLKEGNVTQLFNAGFNSITKIINATEEDLIVVLGENGTKVYLGLREKLNGIDEYILAGSLPFFGRGIGRRKMKKLAETYGSLSTLTYDKVLAVDGFDITTATYVATGVPFYIDLLKDLGDNVSVNIFEKVEGELSEVAVCFTGVRSKELENAIESKGGRVLSSVTKDATHLVAKDPKGKSGKLDKARKSGVIVLSLEDAKSLWF